MGVLLCQLPGGVKEGVVETNEIDPFQNLPCPPNRPVAEVAHGPRYLRPDERTGNAPGVVPKESPQGIRFGFPNDELHQSR